MDQPNPYIVNPNPFEGYNKYVSKNLKTNAETQNVARLCYEIFEMNKDGKELLEKLTEQFIFGNNVFLTSPHPRDDALYWQGFTDLIRMLKRYANQHGEYIKCQKNNK